jgi:hypothetical protein
MAVVTSASVGATIAPSTKADAQGSAGATVWATTATTTVVTRTSTTASSRIDRAFRRTSRIEVVVDVQKSSGGTKSTSTSSGANVRPWKIGSADSRSPHITCAIGSGTSSRFARGSTRTAAKSSARMVVKSCNGRALRRS